MGIMKIKHIMLEKFANFLMSFELKGKDSRMRTRFVKVLAEKIQLVQQEGDDLVKQYADLDESGEPKLTENDGKSYYNISKEKQVEYNREYFIFMNEEFVIEENETNKEMLLLIKDIILNCEMTFKGVEAIEYDTWCELVEGLKYE